VTATKASSNGHLPINGLSLYYEVHGELGTSGTSPLLLIPGAFMSTDSMTSWVSAFAGERAVIVFDQQGHGRTPDTSRGMSDEQFADDAAMLLRALNVERADVMGLLQKVPAARLVILPATSHVGIAGESAVLVPLVSAFLDDAVPATPDLF
jgi:hypothetical protein